MRKALDDGICADRDIFFDDGRGVNDGGGVNGFIQRDGTIE